jgi:PAS domain S-box-containing protein
MGKMIKLPELEGVGINEYVVFEEKLALLNMAVESAGIGTWVFDFARNKRYFDSTASLLLGFSPAKFKRSKKEFLDRIHPDDRIGVIKQLFNRLVVKSEIRADFRSIWPDGTLKFLTAKAKAISDNSGKPLRLIGLIWDVTDQKLLQLHLQENIRKTDSIFSNLNGALFRCKFDDMLTMEYLSVGVKELTGYPYNDFLMNRTLSFASIIYTDDQKRVSKSISDALRNKDSFSVEFRIVSAQNDLKWIWGKGKGIYDGDNVVALEGFFSDINDRKNTEEDLKSSLEQLHQLAQHIEEVREDERVAISRELHDDLGQALTAVKIDLATIKQNVTDMATVLKINKASALVSDTIKTVQRLTSQLRPQIIDDLGLGTAIEWYTKEFEERNRIKIYLDLDSDIVIAPDVSLVLFRIMQEGLTNIARYSGATTTKISLGKSRESVEFSISDNGIGIAEDKIFSKKSFGIISMKERAASLGGQLKIFREDDRFTVINLIFPLINKDKNDNSDL